MIYYLYVGINYFNSSAKWPLRSKHFLFLTFFQVLYLYNSPREKGKNSLFTCIKTMSYWRVEEGWAELYCMVPTPDWKHLNLPFSNPNTAKSEVERAIKSVKENTTISKNGIIRRFKGLRNIGSIPQESFSDFSTSF